MGSFKSGRLRLVKEPAWPWKISIHHGDGFASSKWSKHSTGKSPVPKMDVCSENHL